jgi:hypothetical protein
MPEGNFVKIDRKILSWGWYTDPDTCHLFLHCILRANWKPGEWKGVHYERGQFITSLDSLSKQTGLTVRKVRTALKHLELTGEVTRKTTPKFSIITVNKYDLYQSNDKHSDKQVTSNRQTSGKQVTTVQEGKKNKEGEENKNIPTKNENGWDFSNNDEILRRFLGEDEPNE